MNRLLALFVLICCIAGCAGPAPKEASLDAAAAREVSIVSTVVDVGPIGDVTKGREMSAAEVDRVFERRAEALLFPAGPRNARAEIVLESVLLMTATQSILIGGESIARGTVSLVDDATGEIIVEPREISSGGGGWALGGAVGVATMDRPEVEIEQLAEEFMSRARFALIGNM